MDAVNLLPAEYRQRGRRRGGRTTAAASALDGRRTLRIGGIAALICAVAVGALYWHERSVVHTKKTELAQSQARLAAVQAQVQAIKAQQAEVSARYAVIEGVTNTRMNWDRALVDFARVMPTDSYVTSLSLAAPTPAASVAAGVAGAAPAASQLTINGTTPGTLGVARVLDRIALIPWLSGVTLGSATRATDGSDSFSLTASVSEAH